MMIKSAPTKYLALFLFLVIIMSAAHQANANTCNFVGGVTSGAISFNTTLDPPVGGTVYATVSPLVQFSCTQAKTITMTASPSSGWQLSGPAPSTSSTINYTLGVNLLATSPTTATDVFIGTNSSNTTGTDYVNAPAGVYSNSSQITVTISYSGPGSPIIATLPAGSVTATVINDCTVTGTATVAFGSALDAYTNAGGATGTVTPPAVYCTMNDSISVAEDYGINKLGTQHRLKGSGTNYINYNLSFTSLLNGMGGITDIGGSGAGNHLNLTASIPAGALAAVPADTYNDTVTLTFSY